MKWALDADGKFVNIDNIFSDHPEWKEQREEKWVREIIASLKTPCCNQSVSLVFPNVWNRKPYFRHIRVNNCPYAINNEYLSDTHWEIVDFMEDLFRSPKRIKKIWKFRTLAIKEKLKLIFGKGRFLREVIMRSYGYEKRADIVYNGFAIEVQCSPISIREVRLREKIYRRFGLKTLWILGYAENVIPRVHLSQPEGINLKKRLEMKFLQIRYYKYFTSIQFQDSEKETLEFLQTKGNDSLMFKGLKLEKWRRDLLQHSNVIGVYYRNFLHSKFESIPWYFDIPAVTKYPYRKGFLLILKSRVSEQTTANQ